MAPVLLTIAPTLMGAPAAMTLVSAPVGADTLPVVCVPPVVVVVVCAWVALVPATAALAIALALGMGPVTAGCPCCCTSDVGVLSSFSAETRKPPRTAATASWSANSPASSRSRLGTAPPKGPRHDLSVHVRIVHVLSSGVKGGSVTTPGLLRRRPVQERSAARVQRMLDAAAALLDEVGYDATTTSLIASRAGVSVGSLYQFFPDRRAVLQALAVRSFERFSGALSERIEAAPPKHWEQAVDLVVDGYVEFNRTEPAARVLSFGGPVDRHMLDPDDDNNAVVARALGDV